MISDNGAPALSVAAPEPYGRLYRRPDSDPITYTPTGRPRLPKGEALIEAIISGKLSPSITNVIGVRSSPYLIKWAASKAAQCAVEIEQQYPGSIASRPNKAVSYLKNAHERERDKAATRGTIVHLACENYSRGIEIPELSDEENRCLDSYKRFLDDYNPTFPHLEATVFGETIYGEFFAGTTDFIADISGVAVIGDIKTTRSGLKENLALQLAAVVNAKELILDNHDIIPMPKTDVAVGLHLSPQGYYLKEAKVTGQTWETFCKLRGVWNFHVFGGVLDNFEPVLSDNLTPEFFTNK